ncbi:MAG: hypothetical protein OGM82_12355 [Flavonifractor plautii]|jgi:hypothetical protein|nr:MAG: hypothetical protein OGM82_12355 [Flavonifractor plautii]
MTKNKALFAWFNEFMPFYRASSVLEDVVMPYGTYEYPDGAFDAGEIGLTVNLWFRTESEAIPDEKAQELSQRIGYGGVYILCDEGYIWLKRGSPWCQSLVYQDDPAIKRRYINITAEYLTFS